MEDVDVVWVLVDKQTVAEDEGWWSLWLDQIRVGL